MKAEFKHFSRVALAAILFSGMAVQAGVSADKTVDVPLEDMRKASSEAVQKRALHFARDGIVVLYSGEDEQVQSVVRDVAGEAVSRGFQVKAVLLTTAESGDGVTLYGHDGGPLGPQIKSDKDVKAQTGAQIDALRERLERTGSATAAVDPQDVVRCRYESTTGSLVRKTKVCSSARQDAERTRRAKDWTSDQQNRGASEPMKPAG